MSRPFRLQVLGDLHLEHHRYAPTVASDIDAILVAGDVSPFPARRAIAELEGMFGAAEVPVLYVLGNHEFYGGDWNRTLDAARERAAASEVVTLLEDDAYVLERGEEKLRVLGCTLWVDLELDGRKAGEHLFHRAPFMLTDFGQIDRGMGRLKPSDMIRRHKRSREWLDGQLAAKFDGPTVVLTHHGVGPGSVSRQYQGDPANGLFNSDLTELIEWRRPALWVHGHVHQSFDYLVGGTRIVVNPRGYPRENPSFRDDLVVEIDSPRDAT